MMPIAPCVSERHVVHVTHELSTAGIDKQRQKEVVVGESSDCSSGRVPCSNSCCGSDLCLVWESGFSCNSVSGVKSSTHNLRPGKLSYILY
jgi:hypothetical protein